MERVLTEGVQASTKCASRVDKSNSSLRLSLSRLFPSLSYHVENPHHQNVTHQYTGGYPEARPRTHLVLNGSIVSLPLLSVQHCLKHKRDGASYTTLYNRIQGEEPTFLIVESMKGEVFGGFATSAWSSGCQVPACLPTYLPTYRGVADCGVLYLVLLVLRVCEAVFIGRGTDAALLLQFWLFGCLVEVRLPKDVSTDCRTCVRQRVVCTRKDCLVSLHRTPVTCVCPILPLPVYPPTPSYPVSVFRRGNPYNIHVTVKTSTLPFDCVCM